MIPEPFTITLSVLSLISFLNLARQGAEALYKDIDKYRKATKISVGIIEDADLVRYRLDLWKKTWSILPETHEDFPTYLWGGGWKYLRHLINKIEKLSSDIDDIILPFVYGYVVQAPGADSHASIDGRTLKAEEVRGLATQAANEEKMESVLWWGKKIDFVLSRSSELESLLNKFPDLFTQLDHISAEQYFQRHSRQQKTISNRQRLNIATMKMLVPQAVGTRKTSWTLYNFCKVSGNEDIELELSLLGWEGRQNTARPFHAGVPETLCYYLTISPPTLSFFNINGSPNSEGQDSGVGQPAVPLEVLVERRKKVLGAFHTTFRDVCMELARGASTYLQEPARGDQPQDMPMAFKVSKSTDPVWNSGRQEKKLCELLRSTATDRLSFRQRIEAAYRIAECSLLLLGTSWFSNLKSSNVTRAYLHGVDARYRLSVGPRAEAVDTYHDIHLQTRLVGHLLQELALGSDFTGDDAGALARVKNEFGDQYRSAIDFCYRPQTPASSQILDRDEGSEPLYTSIISEFSNEVVLPLAELHESNISALDESASHMDTGLSFLPSTFLHTPVPPLGGLIPTLSASNERPATFLNSMRATVKAFSVRSASTLGSFGGKDAIVYYTREARFTKVAKNNVPDHARRLAIPKRGMTHDIVLRARDNNDRTVLATLRFEELGHSIVWKRLRGKIDEIYVVDEILAERGIWALEDDVTDEQ